MPFIGHAKSVCCNCKGHPVQQCARVYLLVRKRDTMGAEKTHALSHNEGSLYRSLLNTDSSSVSWEIMESFVCRFLKRLDIQ